MFWNKKKEEEKFYKECLNLYEEDIKNNMKNKNDHDDILELTNNIKSNYIEKINRNELDIMAEKIRLEHNIGKYNTTYIGYITSFYIAITSGVVGLYFQSSGIFNISKIKGFSDSANDTIIAVTRFITFIIILLVLTVLMGDRDTKKNKKMSLINNISLKVIENIEKEINENKVKQEEEINRKELFKEITQYIDNKNIIKNSVVPVIAEIAATSVIKKGIISNLISKIRRESK